MKTSGGLHKSENVMISRDSGLLNAVDSEPFWKAPYEGDG